MQNNCPKVICCSAWAIYSLRLRYICLRMNKGCEGSSVLFNLKIKTRLWDGIWRNINTLGIYMIAWTEWLGPMSCSSWASLLQSKMCSEYRLAAPPHDHASHKHTHTGLILFAWMDFEYTGPTLSNHLTDDIQVICLNYLKSVWISAPFYAFWPFLE